MPAELRRQVIRQHGPCEPPAGLEPAPSRYKRAALSSCAKEARRTARDAARESAEIRTRVRAVACRQVRSAGVEPAASGISGRPAFQLEYEHVTEPLTRIERVLLLYESSALTS